MFGFVNLLKPAGPTSTQFGARLRRVYGRPGAPKIALGHLGTLDPQAAGVLPIAVGKATRLLPLITDRRKQYAGTLVLGRATATADGAGETIATAAVPADIDARLADAVAAFHGAIEQVPPMFSAVHHRGKRLYDFARDGVTVERTARRVTIESLLVLGRDGDVVRFRVACSEGTYVRTLCEDLARACGTVGHLGALLRERSGPFGLTTAVTLDALEAAPHQALLAAEAVLAIPTVVLDVRAAADFRAGRPVSLAHPPLAPHVLVRDAARALVGFGELAGARLAPRRVFE